MGIRFYLPCEDLRHVVARIYAHDAAPSAPEDPRWLIVPDGDVKIIFPFAGAIRCQIGARERLQSASRLIFSGMRTEPGALSFPDHLEAIGVILRPEAVYRLTGVPHHLIVNSTFDGEEIFEGRARRLQEELRQLPREKDRVARLQMRLQEWLRLRDQRDLRFEHAVCRIKQFEGRVSIEALAREIGWSRRQLERKFLEHIGVGPKDLASVLRFHSVYKRMRGAAGSHYLPLIQDHYFDQSHFLKAFKKYTGITPRVYAGTRDYGHIYIPNSAHGTASIEVRVE